MQLRRVGTDNNKTEGAKKAATLADISANDLQAAANRLKKAGETPKRADRPTGQFGIDTDQLMSVKLRSTPARQQRAAANADGPIVSLLDLKAVKLRATSDLNKSPGGTPRLKRSARDIEENQNDTSTDAFLFNQLYKKFKSDPRSQLYTKDEPDTPWTAAIPTKAVSRYNDASAVSSAHAAKLSASKSPSHASARRLSKSPAAAARASRRTSKTPVKSLVM